MALAIAGLALSAAGAAGGIMSANNSARSAAMQNDMSLRNFYLQQRMAQEQMSLAKAGSRDSRGNRTEYVPGVGWITTPTEQTRALQSASDAEQLQRATTDAIRARLVRGRAAQRGIREGDAADPLLTQITSPYQERPSDVRGLLIARNAARASSGNTAVRSRIGMQTLRQGGSGGYGNALTRLAQNGQADLRTALAEAAYDAPVEASARRSATQGDLVNRYGALAAGARAPVDAGFQPEQISGSLAQQLAQRAGGAAGVSNSSGYIRSPQIGSTEGRLPVALDSFGTALREFGRSKEGTRAMQWLDSLFTSGGQGNSPQNNMTPGGGWS